MPINSLYPSFMIIDYLTAYAPHKMTLPTKQWISTAGTLGYGGYEGWDASEVDAKTMIDDLVEVLKAMFLATTSFKLATIYNMPTPTSLPEPVKAYSFSVAGTAVSSAWAKATQRTYTFRSTAYGRYKLVLLDTPTDNTYGQVVTPTSDENLIIAQLRNAAQAWSARDGHQIDAFVGESITLNKRLRREYRMV